MELMKRGKKRFRLDITPLIDVVFLLLIFFMLTFSVQGQGIDISFPGAGATAKEKEVEPPLTLKIDEKGFVSINDKNFPFTSLISVLEEKLTLRKNKSLVVEINDEVQYDLFVRVLDLAKKAGAENFSIVR